MSANHLPTIEYLRERLNYDADTGVLTWKEQPLGNFARAQDGKTWNAKFAGRVAGCVRPDGYLRISIDYRLFFAHRLAYAISTDTDPGTMQIDHIDGDRLNNRLANLRLATHSENMQHRVGQEARNTSGFRGVYRNGRGWKAEVKHNGKSYYFGTFDTPEQAAEAVKAGRALLFGEFAGVGEAA